LAEKADAVIIGGECMRDSVNGLKDTGDAKSTVLFTLDAYVRRVLCISNDRLEAMI